MSVRELGNALGNPLAKSRVDEPIGTIKSFSHTPPAGWLLCNGSSINSEDYPELFELHKSKSYSTYSNTSTLTSTYPVRIVLGKRNGYVWGIHTTSNGVTRNIWYSSTNCATVSSGSQNIVYLSGPFSRSATGYTWFYDYTTYSIYKCYLSSYTSVVVCGTSSGSGVLAVKGDTIIGAAYAGTTKKSVDGGATWTTLPNLTLPTGIVIADNGNIIVFSSNSTYTKISTDGGSSWTSLSSTLTRSAGYNGEFFVTAKNGYLYVVVDQGIYVSKDDGLTWTSTSMTGAFITYDAVNDIIYSSSASGTSNIFVGAVASSDTLTKTNYAWSAHSSHIHAVMADNGNKGNSIACVSSVDTAGCSAMGITINSDTATLLDLYSSVSYIGNTAVKQYEPPTYIKAK